MAELVLVRHGETEWSRTGRHTGRTDVPLTEYGERQARALGTQLQHRRFALVLSSPLVRAWHTAALAGLSHCQPEPDAMEWDYGGTEGRTTAEISADRPGWTIWRDGADPGPGGPLRTGERVEEVGARAARVLDRVRPVLGDGQDAAVVAHGHFLRVLTAVWLGLPPAFGARFSLGTAALCVLGYEHGLEVVRHWNQANPEPALPAV